MKKKKQKQPDCVFRYHNGQRMKALDGWRALMKMEAEFSPEVRLELESMQASKDPRGILLAAKIMRSVLDEPDYSEDEQGNPSGMTDQAVYRVYMEFIAWTKEINDFFGQPQT